MFLLVTVLFIVGVEGDWVFVSSLCRLYDYSAPLTALLLMCASTETRVIQYGFINGGFSAL